MTEGRVPSVACRLAGLLTGYVVRNEQQNLEYPQRDLVRQRQQRYQVPRYELEFVAASRLHILKRPLKPKSFGYKLRRWRQESALTQSAVAAIIQVKASHIAYIEWNKRKRSLAMLRRIASLMDTDAREAFVLVHPEGKN